MHPSAMPQAELLARLENSAGLASKSLALRGLRKQYQATVQEERATSSSEESESDSESDSGSHPDMAASYRRPISPSRSVGQQDRRNTDGPMKAREEARPRSLNRKISTEKAVQPRPSSASPALVRSQRNTTSTPRAKGDALAVMDFESSDLGLIKPGRPRSATSPIERVDQHTGKKRPASRTPSPRSTNASAGRLDALSFLDPDSPEVTEEHIRRVVAEASAQWSPRSASSSSSSNDSLGQRSTADTDVTTPDHSDDGNAAVAVAEQPSSQMGGGQPQQPRSRQDTDEQEHKYGTPEMARGPIKHPHLPPEELQPRIAAPGQGHAKHLPRAEKLPMSGYELLAAKLSNPEGARSRRRSYSKTVPIEEGEPSIKPIYRRFEALNHRLLLHLQDELSELEEQLHRLDTADTQTRRLANCILPASRRADFMAGGELQWHKTDILGKIGFKLGQYNHALSTFKDTQCLPSASLSDVETYRTYLATRNPIAEIETRFLDPADDLVCLASARRPSSSSSSSSVSPALSEDMLTPMPLKTTFGFSPSPSTTAAPSRKSSVDTQDGGSKHDEPGQQQPLFQGVGATGQAAGLGALAIVGPILAFPVVTDFVGRMAVVSVFGLALAALRGKMVDSGIWEGDEQRLLPGVGSEDGMVLLGAYAVVMVMMAMLF